MGREPATDLGENMGANTGKNKLDTLTKYHQSASCRAFTPSKPPNEFPPINPSGKMENAAKEFDNRVGNKFADTVNKYTVHKNRNQGDNAKQSEHQIVMGSRKILE
jgi:hypothetical protein